MCCVDIDTKLNDKDARIFAEAFYKSIVHGSTIKQAFDVAQKSLDGSDDRTTRKFLLLPDDGNHEKTLFGGTAAVVAVKGPKILIKDDTIAPPSIPKICDNFLGRNIDMSRLLGAILQKKVVVLCGPRESGKTAVAVALSHYIWDRRSFIGGKLPYYVHFIDLKERTTITSAMRKILDTLPSDIDAVERLEDVADPTATRLLERIREKEPVLRCCTSTHCTECVARKTAVITETMQKKLRSEGELRGNHHVLLVRVLLQERCSHCLCTRDHPMCSLLFAASGVVGT